MCSRSAVSICGGPFNIETHLLADFHIDARVIDIENLCERGRMSALGLERRRCATSSPSRDISVSRALFSLMRHKCRKTRSHLSISFVHKRGHWSLKDRASVAPNYSGSENAPLRILFCPDSRGSRIQSVSGSWFA